jgi:hypothetical protein
MRGSNWYTKLFNRLFSVVIHVHAYYKATDPVKCRLLLMQVLIYTYGYVVLHLAYGYPSTELPPKRLTKCHFLEQIPATAKKD